MSAGAVVGALVIIRFVAIATITSVVLAVLQAVLGDSPPTCSL